MFGYLITFAIFLMMGLAILVGAIIGIQIAASFSGLAFIVVLGLFCFGLVFLAFWVDYKNKGG